MGTQPHIVTRCPLVEGTRFGAQRRPFPGIFDILARHARENSL